MKKVSVCMITYNHEKYIAQAIESVMMQETDFDYELIIGEDCSTDNTRAICQGYQQKYPDRIKLRLPEKNLGMMPNFIVNLKACTGEYIALIEGDDYWTNSLKLQKQVDFLEENADFAICFHGAKVIFEDGGQNEWLTRFNDNQPEVTAFEDLAKGNYIFTATCIFRNRLFKEFPSWFQSLPAGDWPLNLLNAIHGKIKYINESMAVYRVHKSGTWSMVDNRKNLYKNLLMLEKLSNYFGNQYKYLFTPQIKTHYREILLYHYSIRDQRNFFELYLNNLRYNFNEFSKKWLIYIFFDMYFPFIITLYKRLKY